MQYTIYFEKLKSLNPEDTKTVAELIGLLAPIQPRSCANTEQKQWKPNEGERYWTPEFLYELCADCYDWNGDPYDNRLFSRGLVFRTEAEAKACAKKMLAAVKGETL